jgi:hypothetical protein
LLVLSLFLLRLNWIPIIFRWIWSVWKIDHFQVCLFVFFFAKKGWSKSDCWDEESCR